MPSPDSFRILIVIVPVVLFVIGISKPLYAVIGYMILVYCKTSSYYPQFAAIQAELVFALLILARIFLTGNFFTRLSLNYNRVNMYLYLFILSIFISYMFAWDKQYSWDNAVYHFIKAFIFYIMIVTSITSWEDLKIFTWSFVVMFAYLAYEPFYNIFMGIDSSQAYFGSYYISDVGLLSGHVALANNMNQMIPIAFYLMYSVRKPLYKILASIPLILFTASLIGSGSRGGVVGFAVVAVCIVYFSKHRMFLGVVTALLCIVLFLSTSLSYTASRIDAGSTMSRLTGLTHGIGILERGHILGVGPGCFLFARGRYFGWTMEAHNIYGELIGDLGIPGILAWLFLMYHTFLNLFAVKKKLKALFLEEDFLYYLVMGIQVSLIVRLVISMASHGLYYFYWYLMAGLSIILIKIVDSMSASEEKGKTTTPGFT
ncbi:MAG: O-antigen ligase family protein [Candidatus Cloacimonadia bacterium]